jgi:hypothetical protein
VGKHRDIRHLDLTDADWNAIILVAGWLKDFRTATTLMSTTKRPVLSFTHTVFRGLQEDLRKSIRELSLSTPSALRNGLIEAHRKLSDYYHKSDDSPFYTWAARMCLIYPSALRVNDHLAVLDPRISYEGLKADFYHDEDLMNDLEDAKSKLDAYFRRNYADKASSAPVQATASAPVQSISHIQASPQKDFTQRYRVERRAAFDELRDYYLLPREDFKTCDPVQWWFARKAQFPNLFRLARDILTIPGEFCVTVIMISA